jgi:prepilin-type N-terminal cleavage/methylation domain-containing protein
MRHRRHSGFTLIELMVTVAVAVLLAALAVPSFRELIDKSRLRGATDDIVSLLNVARASAVKYGHDVNVSINSGGWCGGAVSAGDPGSVGDLIPAATACDCTASTVTCIVGTGAQAQNSLVSSSSYSGVTLANINSAIQYTSGAAGEGLTFNSKVGSLDFGSLPSGTLVELTSPSGKYTTRVTISALGQTYVCSVGGKFISGYPSC